MELGRYYAAWHRLMRHWQHTLGDSLMIVGYEDLVTNQEAVSRRMLAHCGLQWEPSCLSFHEGAHAVTTASAVQVRRPIYSSSIGKWRHYQQQLHPLANTLASLEPTHGLAIDLTEAL